MPLYEYECPKCGAQGEAIRPIGDTERPICPRCFVLGIGKDKPYQEMERKIGSIAHFEFKEALA